MDERTVLASLLNVVTMVLSVCVHEFMHAFAAYKLGDDYAAREGRLTLNPLAHADPVGTILLPAIAPFLGFGTFGWGKPVPYIPNNLTRKYTMRAGEAIIAFAGPLANLVLGILTSAILVVCVRYTLLAGDSPIIALLRAMVSINYILFFFNLLPFPPLDGSKVAAWLFGRRADSALDKFSGVGGLGIMIAILFGGFVAVPLAFALRGWVFAGLYYVVG